MAKALETLKALGRYELRMQTDGNLVMYDRDSMRLFGLAATLIEGSVRLCLLWNFIQQTFLRDAVDRLAMKLMAEMLLALLTQHG